MRHIKAHPPGIVNSYMGRDTSEDFQLVMKAAQKRWPDAVLTNSGVVLGLAKIAARQILGKGKDK
jgi:hypothetical protein